MTQAQLIENYINDFGSITPMQAFADLGITKLATRVSEMRKKGYEFKIVTEGALNRYGKKCYFAKYSWKKEN